MLLCASVLVASMPILSLFSWNRFADGDFLASSFEASFIPHANNVTRLLRVESRPLVLRLVLHHHFFPLLSFISSFL